MRVLAVASEIYPLVKTGGLADVVGALPSALAEEGIAVRTLVPGYPAVSDAVAASEVVHAYPDLFGGQATLIAGRVGGLDLLILDAPHLFARPGNPYIAVVGRDWPDNAFRFAALARAGCDVARGLVPALRPDLVHCHDWQTGLLPAYLRFVAARCPPVVITVHNIAFQGLFPATLLGPLGLPAEAFAIEGVEFFGRIGFLKAGLNYADRITTVSPTYAREIQTPDGGLGLDGLLRARGSDVSGILNGIDTSVWNPANDDELVACYDVGRLHRRTANKVALQRRMGIVLDPATLLYGVVSRLTGQKGIDLVVAAIPNLLDQGAALAVLGSGDTPLERDLEAAAAAHPGRVGVILGHDEKLAHLMQAGCDALLVPSRFEPCGLTQLIALRYGAVPVVSRVGGLADSIIDANPMAVTRRVATGIQFAPVTQGALDDTLLRTRALWRDRSVWRRIQKAGMETDVGWHAAARAYAGLFRTLM